jgi:hypothetical protein
MVELTATELFDEHWEPLGGLDSDAHDGFRNDYGLTVGGDGGGDGAMGGSFGREDDSESEINEALRAVRIQVADFAETSVVRTDRDFSYLRTALGMNIIVPSGRISVLRFRAELTGRGKGNVVAIDGFPRDDVEDRAIVSGEITLSVNDALRFVSEALGGAIAGPAGAVVGGKIAEGVGETVQVTVDPWRFKCGDIRNVRVDFSEGLTARPEWHFQGDGIENSCGVALMLRIPRKMKVVTASVNAQWRYKTHLWSRNVGAQSKLVQILPLQ